VKVVRKAGPARTGLEQLISGFDAHGKAAKVGWSANIRYPTGVPVAYVATIHEFGAPEQGIQPRSFMRYTIHAKQTEWKKVVTQVSKQVVNDKRSPESALTVIGLVAEGDVRERISTIQTPELKEATIQARVRKMADGKTVGNLTKPLVETGYMLASLTSVVEEDE
jgi:hypothetical protein